MKFSTRACRGLQCVDTEDKLKWASPCWQTLVLNQGAQAHYTCSERGESGQLIPASWRGGMVHRL